MQTQAMQKITTHYGREIDSKVFNVGQCIDCNGKPVSVVEQQATGFNPGYITVKPVRGGNSYVVWANHCEWIADPLKAIAAQMEQTFSAEGIHVEVTFCRTDMFSIACLNETDLTRARAVLSRVSNARLDDIEIDGECGAFAYYRI